MSQNSIFEILSHTADNQLVTVFDESYSRLIDHFESSPEQRSESICVFERVLSLECLSNTSLGLLTRMCADLKLLYLKNLTKIDQLVAEPSEMACDQYCSVVGENCRISSCIRDAVDRVEPGHSMSDIQSIVPDAISVSSATFKHCNDYGRFYASAAPIFNETINNLFKLCTDLLFRCLELVDRVRVDDDADVERLNGVLEAAFDVGTVVSNLELKAMAQLWKMFMSLLQKHSVALQARFDVRRAIRYFCAEIDAKMTAIYDASPKNRAVTLKVLNFTLKVVLKLCAHFDGRLRECLPDLRLLASSLYRNSSACAKYEGRSAEIAAEIETSLLPAVDPLIATLLRVDGFAKHLCEPTGTRVSALLLLSAMLQKLALSPPEALVCQVLEDALETICACATELHFDVRIAVVAATSLHLPQRVYLYDALLVHTASLVVGAVSERDFPRVEKLLLTHLLRSPLAMKVFVCDLWSIVARYGSDELCFEHGRLLAELARRMQGEKIETVVVRSLLRRVSAFCSLAQRQKLVDSVGGDLEVLLEIVDPETKRASVLDAFVANASKRTEELNASADVDVGDVDLLVGVRIACRTNRIQSEPKLEGLTLAMWHQLGRQKVQLCDCAVYVRCAQHLVSVSKNYALPHSATLPPMRRLASSGSAFLKILILDYLKCLSARKADDLSVDEFSCAVGALFRTLLTDAHALVRERAVETFSYFSHVTAYERVIHVTMADEPQLTECVMNFLQQKVPPVGEKSCDDYLKNLLENRRAVVDRPAAIVETVSDAPRTKKIKLDFDFDGAIVEIDSRLKLLLSNLNSIEPSAAQKNMLRRIVETADELRRYL